MESRSTRIIYLCLIEAFCITFVSSFLSLSYTGPLKRQMGPTMKVDMSFSSFAEPQTKLTHIGPETNNVHVLSNGGSMTPGIVKSFPGEQIKYKYFPFDKFPSMIWKHKFIPDQKSLKPHLSTLEFAKPRYEMKMDIENSAGMVISPKPVKGTPAKEAHEESTTEPEAEFISMRSNDPKSSENSTKSVFKSVRLIKPFRTHNHVAGAIFHIPTSCPEGYLMGPGGICREVFGYFSPMSENLQIFTSAVNKINGQETPQKVPSTFKNSALVTTTTLEQNLQKTSNTTTEDEAVITTVEVIADP